ncbi:tyrosine-type recombinase/integrase [Herbaspirillum frisingense]|uniref:site-specific integrase n=1 Tax=Herbaspirillum frisingense TaxID=92645 RepID=UPI001603787A|nr:site-specific integrase [Herbaspirillum frisingense]QNB09250.1 tyrosine-type recombinase/integrase [Herbaspirillum frisingense]
MAIKPNKRRNEAKFPFTMKRIAALVAPTLRPVDEYSDTVATGLHLCVYRSGRKVFHMRYSVDMKKGSKKIGEFPGTDLDMARKAAHEIRSLIDQGIDPKAQTAVAPAELLFGDFVSHIYLPYAKEHKRSYSSDESKYRVHLKDKFGDIPFSHLTQADIQRFLMEFSKTHRPATRNRMAMLLRSICNHAVEHGVIETNPCQKIKQLAENNVRKDYLRPNQIVPFLKALRNDSNRVMASAIEFIYFTGMRRNEALRAEWKHFDSALKQLHLPKTKNGKERYVPLSGPAIAVIERMKARRSGPYLFPGDDPTKPVSNPTKCLKRVLKEAGISDKFCIHSLRHNWASHAVMNGVPMYDIKELLGHSNIASTQRYAHLSQQHLHDRTNAIALLMEGEKE